MTFLKPSYMMLITIFGMCTMLGDALTVSKGHKELEVLAANSAVGWCNYGDCATCVDSWSCYWHDDGSSEGQCGSTSVDGKKYYDGKGKGLTCEDAAKKRNDIVADAEEKRMAGQRRERQKKEYDESQKAKESVKLDSWAWGRVEADQVAPYLRYFDLDSKVPVAEFVIDSFGESPSLFSKETFDAVFKRFKTEGELKNCRDRLEESEDVKHFFYKPQDGLCIAAIGINVLLKIANALPDKRTKIAGFNKADFLDCFSQMLSVYSAASLGSSSLGFDDVRQIDGFGDPFEKLIHHFALLYTNEAESDNMRTEEFKKLADLNVPISEIEAQVSTLESRVQALKRPGAWCSEWSGGSGHLVPC